jgi:dTDP-glucose 4,6-dehydratase
MHLERRILVTGGSGFLGSHLCERLLEQGANVICVDNFFCGTRTNIEHLLDHKRFELIRHDVTFPLYVEVDEIYNLACPASPVHYQRDPVQTTKTSVHGAINMLGLAKRVRASILQASTSEVYGDPIVHPQPEEYWGNVNPIGPRGVYDEAKRFAEAMTMAYHTFHNVDTRIVRIFNTYGPRMRLRDGRVVPNFIQQALRGEPLTAYGDGMQTRSFQFVSDLVEGVYRLLLSNEIEPVNIGNPGEFTVKQFAEIINHLTDNSAGIIYKDMRTQDDPQVRQPDITKAKRILGWEPSVDVEEGLRRTIPWFREELRRRGELP